MAKNLAIIFGILSGLLIGSNIFLYVMYDKEKKKSDPKGDSGKNVGGKSDIVEVTNMELARKKIVGDITNLPKSCPPNTHQVKMTDGSYACVADNS